MELDAALYEQEEPRAGSLRSALGDGMQSESPDVVLALSWALQLSLCSEPGFAAQPGL